MDQIRYLQLCLFKSFINDIPIDITSHEDLRMIIDDNEMFDEDSLDFLIEIVETFIHYDNSSSTSNDSDHLRDIYGIGAKRAKDLVQMGITTAEELRQAARKNRNLISPTITRILPYHEDLKRRIPCSEVLEISEIIRSHAKNVCKDIIPRFWGPTFVAHTHVVTWTFS